MNTPCNCEQALALTARLDAALAETTSLREDLSDARSQLEAQAEDNRALLAEVAALKGERVRLPSEALWTDYLRRVTVAEAEVAVLRGVLEETPENVEALAEALHASWDGRPEPWPWSKVTGPERQTHVSYAKWALRALRSSLPVLSQGREG